MKFIKLIFSWQLWVSLILALGIFYGIFYYTFSWIKNYTKFGEEIKVPAIKKLGIFKASQILKEYGLDYEIDSFKYDSNYESFQILQVYPEEGSKVKKGRKIFIRCNPKTWKPVSLPNLIDKSKYLTFLQLDMLGLKVGNIFYETNIAKDRIIRVLYHGKEIQAGKFIPKYSKIDLVIGLGLKKDFLVPNMIGLDYLTAKNVLKKNYFEEGLITFKDEQDTFNSFIYYQDPIPGSRLDQGLSINFWLSRLNKKKLEEHISKLDYLYNRRSLINDTLKNLKKNIKMNEKLRYQINSSDDSINKLNPKKKSSLKKLNYKSNLQFQYQLKKNYHILILQKLKIMI